MKIAVLDSGAKKWASAISVASIVAPIITSPATIAITPTDDVHITLTGGTSFVHIESVGAGAGIQFNRPNTSDAGSMITWKTASSQKWKAGPLGDGSENWILYNTAAAANAIAVNSSTNVTTISSLTLVAALPVASGGTGQTSYTNGQLLIGNTTGNTLSKGTITGTSNQVVVTNGGGTITLSGPQDLSTSSSPTFANLTLNATISVAGNCTFGDATADVITFKADAWTCPTSIVITKTAESSIAETLMTWKVSDSSSTFMVKNGTANASAFAPAFEGAIESGVNSTAISFFGTKGANDTTNPAILLLGRYNSGSGNTDLSDTTCIIEIRNRATSIVKFFPVSMTFAKDPYDIVLGTSTGTKIGTATTQKLAFWNKTPIIQPTTGITGATFTANSGTAVNDASTFAGYTVKQIAAALVNVGLLA